MKDKPDASDPVDMAALLSELKRRDLADKAATMSPRELQQYERRQWNNNPCCPDCGSMDHFECHGIVPIQKTTLDGLFKEGK